MKQPKRIKKILKRVLWLTTGLTIGLLALLIMLWQSFPFPLDRLENWPVNPCVTDHGDIPYFSIVGSDQQWRQPIGLDEMGDWLVQASIAIEDKRFYRHNGVDALAIMRAVTQNLAHRKIVSGASTLTMQVCRMMDDRPRTISAKAIEAFRALQLEKLKTKNEILEIYLNIAPYGGNLRGVASAAMAWFGKHPRDLSLAESAFLAGLPQAPSRYYPGRNLKRAIQRQQEVLYQMRRQGLITDRQWQQALLEPIELNPATRQSQAIHAAWMALGRQPQGGQTTIDLEIQKQTQRLTDRHLETLPPGSELAVVIIDIENSSIVALIGSGDPGDPVDGQVNGALARRSPGSTLKPFIYATAMAAGRLNRESIVFDIPIQRAGWSPDNFDHTFAGPVSVSDALRRSLNIPAILVAESIGLARCCGTIESVGIPLPANPLNRGGLALAVGGIEVSLLDLTNAYATLGRYGYRSPPRLFVADPTESTKVLDRQVCMAINHILSSPLRLPDSLAPHPQDDTSWFMWKTGTSSGRLDAWAIGHNCRYAIGIWVGRFRGTGRVDYVGSQSAEPLLIQLFQLPWLRNHTPQPEPPCLMVTQPLPDPIELARDQLRILQPADNERYIALNGKAIIRPAANQTESLTWFLNGRALTSSQINLLELTPGHYELLCIGKSNLSSQVRFMVQSEASIQ